MKFILKFEYIFGHFRAEDVNLFFSGISFRDVMHLYLKQKTLTPSPLTES